MNILLISIGTRGDMEPFLAIGQIMKTRGHEVTCLFPEQFQSLVEDSGFHFESLGPEFMEMLESDLGKFALGGGGSQLKKILAFIKLARIQISNNKNMVRKQFEAIVKLNPDRVIHNGKALYPVVWEVENPGKTVYISPVPYLHYVKGHTHTAFHSNYGEFFNKLTYKLADWGLLKSIMSLMKWIGVSGINKKQIKTALNDHTIIYTVSPQLFKRPAYWPENMQVLGYHERDKTTNWEPETALLDFLDKNEKILFVSFGSMTNPRPEEVTSAFLNILKRHRIPAIINTSSGGLAEPEDYDTSLFHFVSNIPYDWVFPKVHAVIHHGGSGTTHMGAKNGCATLIIPHVIDQFVWNEIIVEKGLGPKGIKIGKITERKLEPLIVDLMNNAGYKSNAEKLAAQMRKEDVLEAKLYEALTQ
ncbi:MAG: glycosyltransferase [Bacteroidia bacterium]